MISGRRLPGWIVRVFGALCAIVWVAAFVATHTPADRLPHAAVSAKVLHFVGYFIIASLLMLTLAGAKFRPAKRSLIALCTMILYGAFDEMTQTFVGRTASVGDWMADSLGAAAAVLVVGFWIGVIVTHHVQAVKARLQRTERRPSGPAAGAGY